MSDVKGRTNVFELELRDEAPDGSLSPTPTHQRITGSGVGGTANSALAKANAAQTASRANRWGARLRGTASEQMKEKQMAIETRVEALSQAVRVNLSTGGSDTTEQTVERAEQYTAFLNKK